MLEAEIYEQGCIFMTIVEDYFFNPPELMQQHSGLVAPLDKAYQAHRLIKMISNRAAMTYEAPLSSADISVSNIVVHTILREEFANQLDLAMHYAIKSLFKDEEFICSSKCTSDLQNIKAIVRLVCFKSGQAYRAIRVSI